MTAAKLPAKIIIVVIFVVQIIKGQQDDLGNNLKLLLSNGLRSQATPKTGQVIITSNANQNSNSFSDPTLQRQLNFQQQIPLEVLNNLFANGQQIIAKKAQPPLGIVNLVNGKLSPGSASDTGFITACPCKGAQGGISLGNSINIKDLSSLTNQPMILTEVLGDKGQPTSYTLQLIPNSSIQNSNGPLRNTLGVESFQNLSPATVQLTQNGFPIQGNLYQSRSIPCTGSSKISVTQSQLPTGQQSMGTFQITSNGVNPNVASRFNSQNPILTQNVLENLANPLNGYSHVSGNANFDSDLNNLAIASGFTPQSLATSPIISQFLNQNPDMGPQFSLPLATSDGYQSPARPHQKSKSSLKTLLPLLVNILREKYTCCPNCKCNNCNKNKPEISSGYSNKATFSPNSEDIKAIINKAEDAENSISSDLKSSKKKSEKFKKAIDSDEDYDYENSYEDEE